MTDAATTTWQAPAKLNLFLHVVGRRDDGYHLLQSAMRLIDLADTVTIALRDDGRVERATDLPGVPADADLTIRAARLLQSATGTSRGATIGVEKRIPIGGGLGGGSSDAATTLLALNHLWGTGLTRTALAALGLALGADVPFFVGGGDAFVEGVGERLTPATFAPACYVVVHPGVAVPTAPIFAAAELTRDTAPLRISDFSTNEPGIFERSGDVALRNDLEPVAASRFDAVRDALAWLSQDADGARGPARMSGSGASVFRAFERSGQAAARIAALPRGWSGWSVRSLAVHPHRALAPD